MEPKTKTRQRLVSSAISFLVGASWVISAASVQALECYAPPQPKRVSRNMPVLPDPSLRQTPDPWGDPGTPEIAGTFACGNNETCTLPKVLGEAQVCALLVVNRGQLVYEYYETANRNCQDPEEPVVVPNNREKQYGIASITKSVVSTLFGHIWSNPARFGPVSLDDAISKHGVGLPPDTHISQVTLRHALTMTSRLKFDDDANCLQKWTIDNAQDKQEPKGKTFLDAVSFYKYKNFWSWPWFGTGFHYAGLNSALLGLTTGNLWAKTAVDEQQRHLNKALEMLIWTKAGMRDEARWKADKKGTPSAFCCFYATARDMAHFGQHVLHNFKAAQTGPDAPIHDWIVQATAQSVPLRNRRCKVEGRDVSIGYGYQWWSLSAGEGFTGLGTKGQFLHVMPDQDTVIVQFGSWPEKWPYATECKVYAAHRFLANRLSK